ncbi:3'-5' exonuclease [Leeia sp. TBRC 13508]|uniref:3'-5' exonuclease n=1 Tax=Leeia speluncae TaxID=2884804 RepID=A0ABS8D2N3_9NEIS|nr:3'-5' exonuclease [Leeia speluncae]MCB6182461.1 3'-5' exonuclease [Leeia speluncae]
MIPVLVFDIETIPDVSGLRKLQGYPSNYTDEDVILSALEKRRESHGNDFLPHYLQRIVAISCVLRSDAGLKVWSLGEEGEDEGSLVKRFFDGVGRYTPQLVSWNGSGFDLPVLHYRAMVNGVAAPRYWDLGEDDREFKWNNYISRYHTRHIDLMDVLAMYSGRANAPLDELSKLCGFPGKLDMDGSQVWRTWLDGGLKAIRDYCETDVANTYLMYCRFQLMRGHFSPEAYQSEVQFVRDSLSHQDGEHWRQFLAAWPV